ncbi:MAG: HAMP domain-containing sensor histidine kinase [Ruminococcus sp.]|nr:HAMP domain-containing sensor histidine kinase [Ruminococcus sp.]
MKSFRILISVVLISIISAFFIVNFTLFSSDNSHSGRPYRIEVSRIEQCIENNQSYDLDDCSYITNVEMLSDENAENFCKSDSDYIISKIGDNIYRFDYSYTPDNNSLVIRVNIAMVSISVCVIGLIVFIYFKIVRPFNKLREMPFELAKGNLTTPLKENKQSYFGRFIWGMDLLREKLEQQKASELAIQKEKKTLVLSISHDIKTPLGIIELYSKALQRGLYNDEEKKNEIAENISEKCEEIKGYVDDIIKASNEDFLNLEVNNSEFYLSELIKSTSNFYDDKLDLLKIDFTIGKYSDVIVKGDLDRAVEVVQNIMENAVKYGDGKSFSMSFAQEDNCAIVSISNSGSSISQNEVTHIFDSFWRGSNVGSNRGSGLGLYICRQLMYKMGGDIFADCKDDIMTVSLVFVIS